MNLQLALIIMTALAPPANVFAAIISSENSGYQKTQLHDCFGESVRNLIYRYEGYVPKNQNFRPGCEVQFGSQGRNEHCRGLRHRRTLKYFVVDANGTENEIIRKGYITLSLPVGKNISTNQIITWDQIRFPKLCYVENGTWFGPFQLPFIKDWPFLTADPRSFGSVQGFSTEIFCHPEGKTRIPVHTASFPFNFAKTIRSFANETNIQGPRLTYQNWLRYSLGNGRVKWIGCDLRQSVASPDQVFRTFYIGMWAGERQVIPSTKAVQLELGLVNLTDSRDLGFKSMCFPAQCFRSKTHSCDTALNFNHQDFSVYYGKTSIENLLYDGQRATHDCLRRTVPRNLTGSVQVEEMTFCTA